MRRSSFGLLALVLVGASGLVACGGDDAGDSSAAAAVTTAAAPATAATLIDVRTPEEYAAGHLAGAVNLNVEDGTLERALPTLDPAGSYRVYCHSGRRSALAAQLLATKGYTHVTDLGGIDQAAATTGLALVTGTA